MKESLATADTALPATASTEPVAKKADLVEATEPAVTKAESAEATEPIAAGKSDLADAVKTFPEPGKEEA